MAFFISCHSSYKRLQALYRLSPGTSKFSCFLVPNIFSILCNASRNGVIVRSGELTIANLEPPGMVVLVIAARPGARPGVYSKFSHFFLKV